MTVNSSFLHWRLPGFWQCRLSLELPCLWQADHPLAPDSPLIWVLVWTYVLLILSTWAMLALRSFPSPLWHPCLLLFYIWYYFLCRVVSIRVFWRKSYGLDWLGCGVCSGVTSSPADLPPPLIILCVFATCVWTHMFLPLALFHCDVLNTGFLPSDH